MKKQLITSLALCLALFAPTAQAMKNKKDDFVSKVPKNTTNYYQLYLSAIDTENPKNTIFEIPKEETKKFEKLFNLIKNDSGYYHIRMKIKEIYFKSSIISKKITPVYDNKSYRSYKVYSELFTNKKDIDKICSAESPKRKPLTFKPLTLDILFMSLIDKISNETVSSEIDYSKLNKLDKLYKHFSQDKELRPFISNINIINLFLLYVKRLVTHPANFYANKRAINLLLQYAGILKTKQTIQIINKNPQDRLKEILTNSTTILDTVVKKVSDQIDVLENTTNKTEQKTVKDTIELNEFIVERVEEIEEVLEDIRSSCQIK